jgi:hypothetical protein
MSFRDRFFGIQWKAFFIVKMRLFFVESWSRFFGKPNVASAKVATGVSLFGIAVYSFIHSGRYHDAFIDDAFITFRHAMNLLEGQGFTCNPGERIEGTSSFFSAVLSTVPIFLNIDPLSFMRWIGRISFMGCTVAAYFSVRACIFEPVGRFLGLGAALVTASTASLAFHSQTGLETLLYAFFIALSLALYLRRFVPASGRQSSLWAAAMGIASLTRPEGPAFFLLLLAISALTKRGGSLRSLGRDLLAFFVVFGPVLGFRLMYFDEWLPNSVLAKSGAALNLRGLHAAALLQAMGYGAFQQRYGFLIAQAGALMLTVFTVLMKSTRFAGMVIGGIIGGCGAVVIWNGMGSDWMPYQRLMIPAVVPLAVGMALGVRAMLFHKEQGVVPSFVFASAILLVSVFFNSRPLQVDVSPIVYEDVRDLGKRLAAGKEPGDVVASDIGGVLPYFWKIKMLDIFGLCDAHLAHHGNLYPGIGKSEIPYIVSHKPTFLAFTFPIGAASFFNHPEFAPIRNDYFLIKWPWQYYARRFHPITILVRKDRPNVQKFAASLKSTLVDPEEEFRRTGFFRGNAGFEKNTNRTPNSNGQNPFSEQSPDGQRQTTTSGNGPRIFWNGAF